VETFDLKTHPLPLFDQDLEAQEGMPRNAQVLREKILLADAVLLACPEYNASVTPLLKNALDWASRTDAASGTGNAWQGKVVGLISASPGPVGGIRGLYVVRQSLLNVNALVISEQAGVGSAFQAFDDEGNLKDERSSGFLDTVIQRLIAVSSAFKA
jgi:NAD(P)H-dependent FMN reductase